MLAQMEVEAEEVRPRKVAGLVSFLRLGEVKVSTAKSSPLK